MKYFSQPFLIACLFLSVFWLACDDDPQITIVEKQFTLDETRQLIYPIGSIPTEGAVFISEQAETFAVSEIIHVDSIGLVYQYEPKEDFIGEDFVEITRASSIGDRRIHQKLLTQISIVVP